jgi:Cytochrome C oxidase, cbb3-type, subunit III
VLADYYSGNPPDFGLCIARAIDRSTGQLSAGQGGRPRVVCHGQNGRARTFHGWLVGAQNLTDAKWQADTTDGQIIHAIRTGPSVMPAFGKKLSPSEIESLAIYVRSFRPTH